MKYKELKTKPEAEAKKFLEELQDQAHALRQKIRQSEEKQTHKLKALKKDIARVHTLLTTLKK
jgi:ribosomal protein L29